MIPEQYKIKNTVKHPTSIIVGGLSRLGLEIAESLIEQGGYVIIVDSFSSSSIDKLGAFPKGALISFVDYQGIASLEDDLRRLDYFFYFAHDNSEEISKVSSQDFLSFSNYLDSSLNLSAKFEAKFLLTTSIRAHQRNITNDELSLNFNPLNEVKHTVYTNYEQQRYAESLVIEYNQRVNLDSRIIRLADLIGDGLDLARPTDFTELIVQACEGDTLKLKNDGLESEYLIHLLDAAYGIIKAQFSQNTNGKIYSLSYEQPITHLSIAYKIQEVDPIPRTIQFIESESSGPSIKLYKPAPNLSQIGWLPRVDLEKAIKQSISLAKISVLEKETVDTSRNRSFVDKLRGFVDLAEKDDEKSNDLNSGPITKLIEERKRKEELRKHKFELSNMSMKDKKRKRAYTPQEKFTRATWDFFGWLGERVNVFKNRNPIEGVLILGLIVGGIFLYFTLVSPLIVLGRNYVFFKSESTNLKASLSEGDTYQGLTNLLRFSGTVEEINSSIEQVSWFTNLVGLSPQMREISLLTESYSTILEGLKDIEKFYGPLNQYLGAYQNNLQLRASESNYLSASDSGFDYSDYLEELSSASAFLEVGLEKVGKGVVMANSLNLNILPEEIAREATELNSLINHRFNNVDAMKLASFTSELMGIDGRKNYAILLQDNTLPRFRGGAYPVLAILGIENGSIVSVSVQSTHDLVFNMSSVPLSEINLTQFTYTQSNAVTFDSLANITDDRKFGEYLRSVIKDSLNVDISGYLELNLNFLESVLSDTDMTFVVNNSEFGNTTYLSSLSSAQSENTTIQQKSRVMAESLANLLYQISLNPREYVNIVAGSLYDSSQTRDVNFGFTSKELDSTYKEVLLNDNKVDSSIKIGYSLIDTKVVNSNKYSTINYAVEARLLSDGRVSYSGNIKPPILGASQDIVACIPNTVLDSSISVSNFNPQRYVINSTDNGKCIVFRVVNETDITFSYIDSNSFLTSNALDRKYSYTFGIEKIRGLAQTIDVELEANAPYKIVTISPGGSTSNAFRLTDQKGYEISMVIESN